MFLKTVLRNRNPQTSESDEYINEAHLHSSKLLHLLKPIVIGRLPKYNLFKILLNQTMQMPSQQTF